MQPSIGILLRELARLYTQASRDHVTSGHDTSSTQSHVLMELGRAGLLTQHELGRRLSLDKGWVSRAVESLVQTGLVAKSRRDNDRRSRWLQLTAKGTSRYQALNESLDAHAEQLMQPLAAEQRVSIHEALVLLLNGLQSEVPPDLTMLAQHYAMADDGPVTDIDKPDSTEKTAPVFEAESIKSEAEVVVEAKPESPTLPAEQTPAIVSEPTAAAVQTATKIEANIPKAIRIAPPPVETAKTSASNRVTTTSRNGQATAPSTRILGSKTLPTRPLLSRQQPRAPLTRSAGSQESTLPAATQTAPLLRTRTQTDSSAHSQQNLRQSTTGLHTTNTVKVAPANSARPSPSAALKSPAPVLRVSTPAPLKVASAVVPPAVAGDSTRQNGSLFSKLLSQGSLFNKLLQREPTVQDDPAETPEPEEVEPMDGISFQAASPSDWNEIRNLLTASGMQVQGALNHLNNFVLATENGRAVGAIGMEIYGDIGLVRSLVVASNMRGKAIGKRLVKHLIERARARQLSALYLLTGRVDPLFERFGFEKMARADMPTKLYVSVELQGPSSTASTGMRLFL